MEFAAALGVPPLNYGIDQLDEDRRTLAKTSLVTVISDSSHASEPAGEPEEGRLLIGQQVTNLPHTRSGPSSTRRGQHACGLFLQEIQESLRGAVKALSLSMHDANRPEQRLSQRHRRQATLRHLGF